MNPADISELDRFFPPCSPCAFCGHKDKRHRLWDAFMENPDSDEDVAMEYETPVEHVRLVRKIRPYRKGKP